MTVNFTTWKGITDGQTYGIPDSEVLDDWADSPNVTSSEITDRDDFDSLSYQGPDPGNDFFPAGSRPVWTVEEGSVSVDDSNSEMRLGQDDMVSTPFDADIDGFVWEFDVEDRGDEIFMTAVFCEDASPSYAGSNEIDNSYYVGAREDDGFFRLDVAVDGDVTNLIEGTYDGGVIKVTRDEDGNWELFEGGESQGTATDTTLSNPETIVCAGRSEVGGDPDANYQYFEAYPSTD